MRAGEARNKVQIQRAAAAQDDAGHPVKSWSRWADWWAKITPLQGGERFASRQWAAELTHLFEGRYLAGVLPTDRLVLVEDERTFQIKTVVNVKERHADMEITATEEVPPRV